MAPPRRWKVAMAKPKKDPSMRFTREVHRVAKMLASARDMSIGEYVEARLVEAMQREWVEVFKDLPYGLPPGKDPPADGDGNGHGRGKKK